MTPRDEALLTAFATEHAPLEALARRFNISFVRLLDALATPAAAAFFEQLERIQALRARIFLFEKLTAAALAPATPPAETRRIAALLTREPRAPRAQQAPRPAAKATPAATSPAPPAPTPAPRAEEPPPPPIWPFGYLEFGHFNPRTLRAAAGAPTPIIPRAHPPPLTRAAA